MFEFKTSAPKNEGGNPSARLKRRAPISNQQRLMTTALALLVCTLVFVLYRDRDFWFPDTQQGEELSAPTSAIASTTPLPDRVGSPSKVARVVHSRSAVSKEPEIPETPPTTITRTVLPPLDVEVVAGPDHRTLHPGSSSLQIDLERDSTPPTIASRPVPVETTTAAVTSRAAERVQVSSDAASVVTHSVSPAYPTLARQMKVQGSVVLRALIGRDGLIQDLHLLSGPPILANAAEEAVRQWHFKPHYQGSGPVETEAKITVNFTISTN